MTSLDVAPIAVAKPIGGYDGYAGRVGMPITLTGTDSYDPDGDAIVSYSWDFNGDGIYGGAADLAYGDPTLAVTTVTYPTPYLGSIGLRVTANGKTSSNISDIDIQAGDADLRIDSVSYSNTVRRTSSDVSIQVTNDAASGRAFNNVLLRLYNGDPYAGGGPVGAVQTLNFSAGQTITVNLTNVDLGGAPILWAFLDTNNSVLEYDELNNISGPTRLDPEMDVEQPVGTALTDSGTASNFGTLIIGETSLKTYTITNSGTLNLTGIAATKDGTHSGDFILTQPLASSLAPGASTTFTVTYTPTAADTRTAAVHILSNDFDEASFEISLTGFARAYPTNITLSTATINENNAANATVGTLTTTDTNVADTHSYSLVAGTGDEDNASFTIASNLLKLVPSADYETKLTYNLRLRTTDQTGLTFEKAFVVTIVKLNEAPVLAATQLNSTSVESAGVATGTLGVNLFSASAVTDIDFVSASMGGGNIRVTFAEYITGDLIELPTGVTHSLNAVQLSGTNVQISNGSAWATIATRDATNTGIGKALTLTLNAAATEDNIGYVIDALMFRSTSDNPTVNQTKLTRTYSLVVNDGNNNALAGGPAALDSNTIAGGTLTITPTNDFPVVDLNGGTAGVNHAVTWTEVANGTHVTAAMTSSATMTDADNTHFSSMNFTLGGVLDGNSEVVTIGGTGFPLATDATNTVVTGGFKVSYNSTTDVFTIEPNGAAYATLASFQTLLNGVTYNNLTNNPTDGDRTFTVMVTDAGLNNLAGVGSVSSTLVTTTINVNPVNDQPVITDLVAASYFENAINAAAATLDATATVTDIDSPDYDSGTLTVSGLVAAQDLVSLPIGAVAALDNVQLTGSNVEVNDGSNWVVVGTAAGGNGNNFVVTFNSSATARSAELVIENLTFANSSHNPTLTRTLTLTLNDNDGNATQAATIGVTIKLDNDAPDITGTVGLAYTEQGAASAFVSGATTSDPDQPTNFRPNATNVGNLRVALDGYVTGDLLSVAHIGTAAGQIGVSGTTISYANVSFATTTGGTAADLVITFSSTTATPAAVGALINALRYRSTSDDPTVNSTDPTRVVTVTLNDGGNTKDATSSSLPLTDSVTGTISLTALNDLPVIVVTGAASFSENGLALTVDSTATVTDLDDTQIAGGSVRISTGFVLGDTLAVTAAGDITGSYNAATGELILSGTDTLANYQAVMRSLTYVTASEDPTDNATKLARVLTYSLTDANSDNVGAGTGTTTKTINITPSNDKPVVTAGANLAYAENDAATAIDGTMTVNDPDDTQITGATATISTGLTTGDLLAVTTQNGISGSYTAATGVLALTGTTTLANYQTALRSVTYRSTSEDPTVTAVNRTVTWVVTDANSDSAGAQTSVAVTSTITITPSNDKPVVTAGATLAYTENAAATAIDVTMTVSDADDTQITEATATISAGLTTGDLLAVATQNGISGTYSAGVLTLTGTATLAHYQTALRSVTYRSTSEDPTATLASRTVTWTVTDANSDLAGAQPSVAVTSTINITPINDKPVVTAGATLAYAENDAATAIDGTVTVNDADDTQMAGATVTISAGFTTGDLLAVTTQNGISGTYNAGVLTLTGAATLADYQVALRSVTYQSTSEDPTVTAVNRTVTWVVTDANSDLAGAQASVAVTSTITITPSNDKPVVTAGATLAYTENAAATAIDGTVTVNDADDIQIAGATATISAGLTTGDVLAVTTLDGISGTYSSVTGVLTLTGTKTLAQYQAAFRRVTYQSTSEDPTATFASRTVTWAVTDANSDLAGAQTSVAVNSTINLTALKDLPVIVVTGAASFSENGLALTVDSTTTVADADDALIDGGSVSISTGFLPGDTLTTTDSGNVIYSYDSAAGVLTLSGTDTLARYQTVLRSLTYVTASEDPTDNATKLTRVLTYSLTDANSDGLGAGTGTTTKNINITPINDRPVVTAGATLAYAENDAATAIDGTVTVNDADDTQITRATATISAGLTTGDLLAVATQSGISGAYDAGTGALTLTGTTTLANYQTALRSVTYRSTSEDPTVTAVNRTVTWTVTDANSDSAGAQTSVAVTSTITITPSNDKPVVTAGATLAYTENASATAIDGAMTVTDADDTQITGATATVSAGLSAGDLLAIATQNGISGTYDAGTGALTLTGTATLAHYQTALRSVTYRSTSEDPTATFASRTVTWAVTDANSDLAGAQTSAAVTSTITITPSNDKPVVTAGATLAYAENAAATAIDGTVTVNDADDTQITRATATISAGLTTGDLLAVATQNGISGTYNAGVLTLTGTATLADYQAALRSVTYQSTSEDPTATFASRTVTWAVTDANSDLAGAQTSVAVTSTITITPSNDKPVVTAGATLAYTENAAATAIDGTVTVNDADDTQIAGATATISTGLTTGDLLAVTTLNGISGTYSAGTGALTLSGTATLAHYQAALRRVTYQSTSKDPTATAGSRTVTWAVTDANSDLTVAETSLVVTSTINITPSNDKPIVTAGATLAYAENAAATAIDGTMTVSDADDTQIAGATATISAGLTAGDLLAVTMQNGISGTYSAGVLTLTGTATLANYQTALRSVTYQSTSEDPTATTSSRTVTWVVTDANSDLAGAQTSVAVTSTINITPSSDKPVVTAGATLAYTENAAATAVDGTMTVNDADDTQINGATATIAAGLTAGDLLAVTTQNGISGTYSAGVLTLTGTASLANYQTALRSVTYHSTSDYPTQTSTSRTISWRVTDANSDLAGTETSVAVTSTISITEVNDAPVNTYPATIALYENASFSFTGLNTLSVADAELNMASAQLSAAHGTLLVNLAGGATISAGTNGRGSMAISGTEAQINAALASLTYSGNQYFNGLDTLTIASTDADSNPLTDTDSIAITVYSVNSAPAGGDGVVSVPMNGSYALKAADFGFNDSNDSPANLLARVLVTSLPGSSKGTLMLSGVAVTAGSYVTVEDISAGLLVYTPPADENGFAYTSFTFQVEDDGGTDNGGLNLDASANLMTIHVGGIVPQTLCFVAPLEAPQSQVLSLYGNATSGLNVVFTVVSGPGTLVGNLLTFTGSGSVVVRASQPGDLTYRPASTVDQTINAVNLSIPISVSDGWNVQHGTGAASQANAVALKLSGQVAQFVAVTGYVTGAGGKKDLYVTKRDAATGAEVWGKTHVGAAGLDDEGSAVAFDGAGNIVVAGHETNVSGNTDIVVLKYAAADGTLLWSQKFVGTDGVTDKGADAVGSYDASNQVVKGRKNLVVGQTDEVIVGGYVTNAGGGRDLLVVKYNSDGTKAWHQTYDGASGVDYANAVVVDAAGDVYAAGGSRSGSSGGTLDGITLKYAASDGALVWHARYDNGKVDEVTSLMIDRDGNPVVGGYTQQTTYDMFMVRYNKDLDPMSALATTILWESRFDNPAYNSSEAVWDMGLVFGKDVMLTGTSYSGSGVYNAYTMRFKGTCVEGARWDREFAGAARGQDQLVAMGADYFGSPVVVGYTQLAGGKYAIQTMKHDAEAGSLLWSKTYESANGNSEPRAVAVDPSGNVFVIGYTTVAGGVTKVLVQNYSPYTNPTRAAQTISFTNPGAQLAGRTITLGATVDSGLQVEYAVISGPATVTGNSLVLRGDGNVTLRASQPGSGDYLPATPVEVTFSVSRSSQTISFNLPVKIHQVNGQWESFPLAGVCSSGLPLTYEVLSGPATITDGVLQLSGAGVVVVRASQIGDSSYDPAVSVDRTVTGEVMGSFTILDGFHVNWTDRSLLDVTDSSSFAEGEAVAVALGLTGNDATAGYVAGFVKGATGKDLYLTKYTHNISTGAAAQSWVRRMNGSASGDDEAAAVAVDASGNVIVAGYVTTSTGRDVYVAKYDSNGGDGTGTPGSSNPIWEYTYNGTSNGRDMALSLALQGTSHVIVGGRAEGTGTGDDFFAAKLNSSDGTAVWANQNNRTSTLSDIPAKVAVGSDGTVVLAGISGSGNSANAWTVKLDSGSGALLWQKVYDFAKKPDAMRGLALDGANNVIVSGYSQGTNYDMYTAKYEAGTGSIIWEKRHNGSFNSSDSAWDVIVDRQGYVLVTGTSYRASSVKDGMTLKYSGLDGTLEWAKRPFNNLGTATANDENFSIALDGLGNLVLVGYTSNATTGTDYYVARHLNNGGVTDGDTAGEAVFDGYYGGNDNIYQVRMDPNGAIWMVGFTATVSGVRQPLVVRLAPGP